ncbi:MAG: TonB-dependent receptor plug domain-containing protein [Kordiimonadaceae bacterium]|nr:TonB-dependent receptor plug domain-containing protein [Kordiimonadaceae bacterium]
MNKRLLLLSLIGTFIFSSVAFAQADDPVEEYSPITRYSFDYFAEFGPVTLLDMLERIPDAKQILDKSNQGNRPAASKRGFGSAGDQILINGKRLSGKANNISDNLARISAGNVQQIQLIRGATEGLDVQSDGLVINVILEAGISTSTTFWKVGGVYYEGHDVKPTFTLSHSGSTGKLEYMVGVERKHWEFRFDRDEIYQDGDGVQTGNLFVEGAYLRPSTAFTSNVTYTAVENGTLRLNGLYEPRDNNGKEIRIEEGNRPFYRFSDRQGGGSKWEVGGDYVRRLGFLGQLKTLFVVNRDKNEDLVERFNAPEAVFNNQSLETILNRSEKIIRLFLNKNITTKQSLEAGGEGAFNSYDQSFNQLAFSDEDTISSILANDTVEISEKRYELFVNHNYNISPKMALQSSLVAEFSTITADSILPGGDVSRRQSSFTFLKPRFNFSYDVTAQDQVRLLAEKKVSQLDFKNFVTRFDNGTQQLIFGNTGIKPQENWEFSLAYEHRFNNNLGSIELELYHHRYKDLIDNVDFTQYEDELGNSIGADAFFALPPSTTLRDSINFTAKSGNVDRATAYGVKVKGNIRLGFIGLAEAVLNVDYEYSKRKTTDQFTGLWRAMDRRSEHTIKVGFRHDITDWKASYGFNGVFRSNYERFYINYYWPSDPYPELSAFAELTVFKGIKLRVEGAQLIGKRQRSTRFNYNDHIKFGDISRVDLRDTRTAQEIRFSLQGTF